MVALLRLDGVSASLPRGEHWPFLDLLRIAAALLVLSGHMRGLLFASIQAVPDPTLLTQVFYLLTGVHREGVAIFFAVSGFLVGGGVWRSISQGRFDVRSYLTSRFVRIYLVFVPAVLLTLVLDWAGRHYLLDTRFYGVRPLLPVGVTSGWTWSQLACHAVGLQGIVCPPLGANVPLWSLGFEWVFYLVAPLVFGLCLSRRSVLVRAGGIAVVFLALASLAGGILIWLPWFSIWIAGALAAEVARRRAWPLAAGVSGLSVIAIGMVLARSRAVPPEITDLMVGLGTALAIACRGLLEWCPFQRLVQAGADMSYSLYLVHLPVAVFLGALLEKAGWPSNLVQPSPAAITVFVGMELVTLAAAYAFASATERYTGAVRGLLSARRSVAAGSLTPV